MPITLIEAVTGKPPPYAWTGGPNPHDLRPEYLALCSLVAAHDFDAAVYLATEAPQLEGWRNTSNLNLLMRWSTTPQGHSYWNQIYTLLRECNIHDDGFRQSWVVRADGTIYSGTYDEDDDEDEDSWDPEDEY